MKAIKTLDSCMDSRFLEVSCVSHKSVFNVTGSMNKSKHILPSYVVKFSKGIELHIHRL